MGGGKINGGNSMMIIRSGIPGETPMNTQMEEDAWKNCLWLEVIFKLINFNN